MQEVKDHFSRSQHASELALDAELIVDIAPHAA
jgi:hypothetical protein